MRILGSRSLKHCFHGCIWLQLYGPSRVKYGHYAVLCDKRAPKTRIDLRYTINLKYEGIIGARCETCRRLYYERGYYRR